MPMLLFLPAIMFFATVTAMGQVAMQTFPVAPAVDPAKARRRAFKVIKGGQQIVLVGTERARYRNRKDHRCAAA